MNYVLHEHFADKRLFDFFIIRGNEATAELPCQSVCNHSTNGSQNMTSISIKSTEIWSSCEWRRPKKCAEIFLCFSKPVQNVEFASKSTVLLWLIQFYCIDNANCWHFNRRSHPNVFDRVFPLVDLIPFVLWFGAICQWILWVVIGTSENLLKKLKYHFKFNSIPITTLRRLQFRLICFRKTPPLAIVFLIEYQV